MADEFQLILTTCPDHNSAKKIAEHVVKSRLAACVNILPGIQSIYEWQDELQSSEEHLLLIKTRRDRYTELESNILSLHPYELPEIIAVPVKNGLTDYLNWINSCIC